MFTKLRLKLVLLRKKEPSAALKTAMCKIGLHWSGITDGGGMGDAMRCDHCKVYKYPEVFPGVIINARSRD